jgi:hypothetical protein
MAFEIIRRLVSCEKRREDQKQQFSSSQVKVKSLSGGCFPFSISALFSLWWCVDGGVHL